MKVFSTPKVGGLYNWRTEMPNPNNEANAISFSNKTIGVKNVTTTILSLVGSGYISKIITDFNSGMRIYIDGELVVDALLFPSGQKNLLSLTDFGNYDLNQPIAFEKSLVITGITNHPTSSTTYYSEIKYIRTS